MKSIFSSLILMFVFAITTSAQVITPQPSPACKMTQTVGVTDVTIEYSRPSMKERKIFGGLVPYDQMWRLGANKNTMITFSNKVKINGIELDKGTYAVYAKPNVRQWEIYFYKTTDNWGLPNDFSDDQVALVTRANVRRLPLAFETFLINVSQIRNSTAEIQFIWDKTLVALELEVPTKEIVKSSIEKMMAGPSQDEYHNAARFYLEENMNLDEALEMVNKATENNDKFWMLRTKALILGKLGRKSEAIQVAKRSSELAKQAGYDSYIDMNNKSIKKWSSK